MSIVRLARTGTVVPGDFTCADRDADPRFDDVTRWPDLLMAVGAADPEGGSRLAVRGDARALWLMIVEHGRCCRSASSRRWGYGVGILAAAQAHA
ncbi:hypothetical protein [Methylobacterium aquaticum]|uniref:Uncharacterized protein n=1 Tax=Methylobacterium aquaticum TaxID=270351 RepID=A0A0J6S6H7_9HYPH|nr:hypothetical protein [Methylobacterium aquaticum]KMO29028.1 hypothetical protein VP06_25665 [Methylobacterium aquaticum]